VEIDADHASRVDRIAHSVREAGAGKVRLRKDTSNLFRDRASNASRALDVRDFSHVLAVDAARGLVEAEGMVTYEDLVTATLAHGMVPAVVPELKTITIGGAVSTAAVALWVEDRGPGLPASNGAALFGRFVRSGADEPEQSGVGLGLWIVQSIVERHGGRVEAGGSGAGARIKVVLPVEPAPAGD